MENTDPCSIEQHFCRLRGSAKSKQDFASFITSFIPILTDLLNDPLNSKSKVIDYQNDLLCPKRFSQTKDLYDFLELLGFQERNAQYVHLNSDENMMKVENCLDLLNSYTGSEITTLEELSEVDVEEEDLDHISFEKKSKSDPNIQERKEPREKSSSGKVKKFFLLKHLKKEESESPMCSFKMEQIGKCRSVDYLFNENGFFQQANRGNSQKKESRDKRFLKELFHTYDRNAKKWNI